MRLGATTRGSKWGEVRQDKMLYIYGVIGTVWEVINAGVQNERFAVLNGGFNQVAPCNSREVQKVKEPEGKYALWFR